jgi:hypothetical protein
MTDTNKEYYLDSDGSIVHYPDAYKVTPLQREEAEKLGKYIVAQQDTIEASFLKMGQALALFEEQEMYKAYGVPSMRVWVKEHCHFSYEHATRLIRIVRDLLPVLGEVETLLPVSTMKEMLPMLTEGATPEEIREAFEEVQGLTTRDAKARLRELRGVEEPPIPTTFRASVVQGETYNFVSIMRYGDDGDIYEVTPQPLRIKPKDFPRWAERFGAFMEVKD